MVAGLYIHIPFCTKRCPYCHFYVIPEREDHKDLLLEALLLDWRQTPIKGTDLTSLYLGGGTPTLLGKHRLETLLSTINPSRAAEVTIEANPETLDPEAVKAYRTMGINRISLGVQSLHDPSLIALGRTHTSSKALSAIDNISQGGIDNFSIDLMLELPDQTPQSLKQTLDAIPDVPHLSLYNLTIEPHTSFYKNKEKLNLPSDEMGKAFLDQTVAHLELMGLKRYEISAFAKPGFEAVHNTGYWKAHPFYGIGPSAFGYIDGTRYRKVANLHKYARAMKNDEDGIDFEETLPYPQNVHELFAVRLRLIEGAPTEGLPKETQSILDRLEKESFLTIESKRATLTEKGLLFYDEVAAELI